MGPFEIGVMVNNLEPDRLRAFNQAVHLRFRVVHTSALPEEWLNEPRRTEYINAAKRSGVVIDTMFIGFDGQSYADRATIRRTVGLAASELRPHRCQIALAYGALAHQLGVSSLAMHLGFLPEKPGSSDYREVVDSVRSILELFQPNGQELRIETGQESAKDLLAFIREVDRPNLTVNFDPANFIIYGTDRPIAALERLAPLVRGFHCKDAMWPKQPGVLGREVPVGEGEVPFSDLLRHLRTIGFAGPLIIEREHGLRVREDVVAARTYLQRLMSEAAG